MAQQNPFTDTASLRRGQYRDDGNLRSRVSLHDDYGTNPVSWFSWLRSRLRLSPGARVLDVGAGPAWLWARNAETLPALELVVSDASRGMLATARGNLEREAVSARFALLDARELSFPDRSFDIVLANHMLYHVSDLDRVLAELRRVLSPGGRFHASTNGSAHMQELDALAQEVLPDFRGFSETSLNGFRLETGTAELTRHFVDVELERYPDGLRVTDAGPLVDYVLSLTAGRGVEPEREHALRERVAREIAARGAFEITKDPGLFSARSPV